MATISSNCIMPPKLEIGAQKTKKLCRGKVKNISKAARVQTKTIFLR